MAIKLTKVIRREMLSTEQQGKNKGKALIVELLPGDELSFRVKGTRQVYQIFLGHCYRLAQMQTLESIYRKQMEEYTRKKKLGQKRLRKPRRYSLPFNKIYYKALGQ